MDIQNIYLIIAGVIIYIVFQKPIDAFVDRIKARFGRKEQ